MTLVKYIEPKTLAPYHGEAKRLLNGNDAEASRAMVAATRAFWDVYDLAQSQSAKFKRDAEIYLPSFVDCILDLARLGITPGSDEAYLIPYFSKNRNAYEVEVIVGPRGLMRLAYESGTVARILAETVCEGDEFDYDYDLGTFKFKKGKRSFASQHERHEATTAAFAQAIIYAQGMTDAQHQKRLIVLSRGDIEYYRGFSKAPDGDLWGKHFDGAAKKTAIKRLCEQLPKRDGKFGMAMRETHTGGFLRPADWGTVEAPQMVAPTNRFALGAAPEAATAKPAPTRAELSARWEALAKQLADVGEQVTAEQLEALKAEFLDFLMRGEQIAFNVAGDEFQRVLRGGLLLA